MQEGLDRAATWQVELDAVFVLHHPHSQFEQFDDDRRGLVPGQFSALQQFGAQGVMQLIGGAGEKQAHVVSRKVAIRGAVAGQIVFHHLDEILVLAPGAIQLGVQHLRGRLLQGGDNKAGVIAESHDFGFQDGAKGLRPGAGLIVDLVEGARALRRLLFGEAGVVAAGIVQPPGGLQMWLGHFFQAAVAGQAEQKIRVRIVERQLHQFHVGKMSVTTQQDAGLGPVLAQPLEHPLEDHRVLCPLRAFAGAQGCGDELARQALEQKQRQVAVTLVMMIVKRQLLLAMGLVFGMIHVEHDHLWRFGVAGDKLFHKGLGQAVKVAIVGGIFQAREGRSAGQILLSLKRLALGAELEHRVTAQGVGVVGIGIAASDLEDPLGQQSTKRVVDVGRVTAVVDGLGQSMDQADLLVNAPQQQGAEVG